MSQAGTPDGSFNLAAWSDTPIAPSETICFPVLVEYLEEEIRAFEPDDTDPDLDEVTIDHLAKCVPSLLEAALEKSGLTIMPVSWVHEEKHSPKTLAKAVDDQIAGYEGYPTHPFE